MMLFHEFSMFLNLTDIISHDDDDLRSLGSSDVQGKVTRITMKGLDTVETLSAGARGSIFLLL